MRWRRIAVTIVPVVACLIALSLASHVLVDWLWFSAVGYSDVFWTIFGAKLILFFAVFLTSAVAIRMSGRLAFRFARRRGPWSSAVLDQGSAAVPSLRDTLPDLFARASPRVSWRLLIAGAAAAFGMLIAVGETGNWDLILRFIYQVPYGQNDPLFDKDIGFYLFSLPGLRRAQELDAVDPALERPDGRQRCTSCMAKSIWTPASLAHFARRHRPWLRAAGSLFRGEGLVLCAWTASCCSTTTTASSSGPATPTSMSSCPILWLLIGLAAAAAVVAWVNVRLRTYRLAIGGGGAGLRQLVRSCAELFPALFQRFFVKPSELQLETPYIQRNIALTREAYNLRQITVKPFPAEQGLSFQSLQDNRGTIDNIRLWDWQPLMDTYAQLQEIRTYYKFLDVDVDRYQIDGSYQQVTLAARELAPSLLSANAQTWVNLHLLFTHGNGVVMSPVTQKSAEGLPIFYLKDIPPVASGGPSDNRAAHLFRTRAPSAYVIVKGSTPEFDYPKGKDNVYANYDGADGIADRRDRLEDAVRLVFRRREHPAQPLHHRREQDPAPSQHPGSRADDRAVPATGSRSLRR